MIVLAIDPGDVWYEWWWNVMSPALAEASQTLAAAEAPGRVAALEAALERVVAVWDGPTNVPYGNLMSEAIEAARPALLAAPASPAGVSGAVEMPSGKCPGCWSAATFRLPPDWQDRVERGQSMPIVGCGNPWHYAGTEWSGTAPAPTLSEPAARCGAGVYATHAGIPTVVTCGELHDAETHDHGSLDFDHDFTPGGSDE